MRIPLDEALAALTRPDGAPPPPAAQEMLQGLPARRQPLLPLAALALLVVLAVVAALALVPQHGTAPAGSTPSPSPEFSWNGQDPGDQAFTQREVARRCPLASGQRYSRNNASAVAGGTVTILKPTEVDSEDGTTGTICALGYDAAPSRTAVTTAEATSSGDQLVQACSRHTGLDLGGKGWQLVASDTRSEQGPVTTQVAFLWTDEGVAKPRWLAACTLSTGDPSNFLQLTDLGSDAAVQHCPQTGTSHTVDGTAGNGTGRLTQVQLEGPEPVMTADGLSLDTRVARIVVQVPGHTGQAELAVTKGIAMGTSLLVPHPPVLIRGDDATVPTQVRLVDAEGRLLRTCTVNN